MAKLMGRISHSVVVCLIVLLASAGDGRGDVVDGSNVIDVTTAGPDDSVTVGQRFAVTISFSAPDSLRAVARDFDAGHCRVLSLAWIDSTSNGRAQRQANAVMVAVALDSVSVPANAFDYVTPSGDTLRVWSDAFDVSLKRIAETSEDLRPLKSQWEVPPDYVKWAGIVLAVLAALAAIIWYVRRRRRRVVQSVPEVVLPPDEIALAELERIASLRLVEQGELKTYYTLVADAVRRYVGARFGVETMDRTTHEVLAELARRRTAIDGLASLLGESDLVKFAKLRPDAATALRAVDSARDIVITTTPREAPPVAMGNGA
jgi:Arc/MetJ family transcription regulator